MLEIRYFVAALSRKTTQNNSRKLNNELSTPDSLRKVIQSVCLPLPPPRLPPPYPLHAASQDGVRSIS